MDKNQNEMKNAANELDVDLNVMGSSIIEKVTAAAVNEGTFIESRMAIAENAALVLGLEPDGVGMLTALAKDAAEKEVRKSKIQNLANNLDVDAINAAYTAFVAAMVTLKMGKPVQVTFNDLAQEALALKTAQNVELSRRDGFEGVITDMQNIMMDGEIPGFKEAITRELGVKAGEVTDLGGVDVSSIKKAKSTRKSKSALSSALNKLQPK